MTPEELKEVQRKLDESRALRKDRGFRDDLLNISQDFNANITGNKYAPVNNNKYNEEDIKRYEKLIDDSKASKERTANFQQSQRITKEGGIPLNYDPIKGEYFYLKGDEKIYVNAEDTEVKKSAENSTAKGNLSLGQKKFARLQPADRQILLGYRNSKRALNAIGELWGAVKSGTGTGKIRSLWEKVKGWLPGLGGDVNFAKLKTYTTNLLAKYVKSISGASATDAEAQRLAQYVPTEGDDEDIFEGKLIGFSSELTSSRADRLGLLSNQGFDTSFFSKGDLWKPSTLTSSPKIEKEEKKVIKEVKKEEEKVEKEEKKIDKEEKEELVKPAKKGIKLKGKDVVDGEGNPILDVNIIANSEDGTVFIVGGKKKYKYTTENGGWTLASKPRPGKEALPIKKEVAGSNVLNPDV